MDREKLLEEYLAARESHAALATGRFAVFAVSDGKAGNVDNDLTREAIALMHERAQTLRVRLISADPDLDPNPGGARSHCLVPPPSGGRR